MILPFVVLRRLDCILADTKPQVLELASSLPAGMDDEMRDRMLFDAAGPNFQVYNLSRFHVCVLFAGRTLWIFIATCSTTSRSSLRAFETSSSRSSCSPGQLKRLNDAGLLYRVFEQFTQIDLHPDAISNLEMGYFVSRN